MFAKLKLWLVGGSGLKQTVQEAAQEAVRDGILDGVRLGVEEAIENLLTHQIVDNSPQLIESKVAVKITVEDLKGLKKSELIELGRENGIDVGEDMTVAEIKSALVEV